MEQFELAGSGAFRADGYEAVFQGLTLTRDGNTWTLTSPTFSLSLANVRSLIDVRWIDGTLHNLNVRIDCPVSYQSFTRFVGDFKNV